MSSAETAVGSYISNVFTHTASDPCTFIYAFGGGGRSGSDHQKKSSESCIPWQSQTLAENLPFPDVFPLKMFLFNTFIRTRAHSRSVGR